MDHNILRLIKNVDWKFNEDVSYLYVDTDTSDVESANDLHMAIGLIPMDTHFVADDEKNYQIRCGHNYLHASDISSLRLFVKTFHLVITNKGETIKHILEERLKAFNEYERFDKLYGEFIDEKWE